MDPMQKYSPGQDWEPNAQWLNAVTDLLNRTRDEQTLLSPAAIVAPRNDKIYVVNGAGQALDQFGVVGLGSLAITPTSNIAEWRNRILFNSASPSPSASFGILQGPIPNDSKSVAEIFIDGVSRCKISITTSTDGYAAPIAADYVKLLAQSAVGPARIIWHSAPSAWSGATAYVIGDMVSVAGTYYTCTANHTNHTPPNASYWSVGAARWAVIRFGDSVPTCTAVTLVEEQARCEAGSLNIYSRTVTLNVVSGCLTKSLGSWAFTRSEGSCGSITINYTNINDFTTFIQNVWYFNTYDQKIYINISNVWYGYCICVSGSSATGSSNTGTIATGCCPDRLTAATLYAVVTNKTGLCSCLPDNFTLEYNPGTDQWEVPSSVDGCLATTGISTAPYISCKSPASTWTFTGFGFGATTTVSTSCASGGAFQLVFDVDGGVLCPGGSFRVTIIE